MERLYKYYPEDFGKLPVKVLHIDLEFDIYDDHTNVLSKIKSQVLEESITQLQLDAKNLEITSVTCEEVETKYRYVFDDNKLVITFSQPLLLGEEFTLIIKNLCRPTKHILEGLYYDVTPPGLPPTQITQCQQWGFQRIIPCFDDMTAKCTYTTTITADSRYTHMISNGDVAVERHSIADGRDQIVYHNTKTPMAPYLFFLGVGTYASTTREFEYPHGKIFTLELLARTDVDKNIAQRALDILHDAILWIHLFTGEQAYTDLEKRKRLYTLVQEREKLKQLNEDLTSIRKTIKELANELVLGYEYTGTVYREIGMQNSDIGGMENVGNTTITMNRIMPFPDMTDGPFEYMFAVKVHEFYHNLNGSEVTGHDPFQLWLNEAVTVHIERGFSSFMFGSTYVRIGDIISLLSPGGGTFAQDEGPASMPIEPDGFNDPNELITAITYVKAPEVVRMIETVIGKENFSKGLALYHSRYKHGNATSNEWIGAMEEVSGMSLKPMMKGWLKKTNYPHVRMNATYNKFKKVFTIILQQTNASETDAWEFPFVVALCDSEGNVLAEKVVHITHSYQEIVFEDVERPAYISANRGYSFYGKLYSDTPEDELLLQVRTDRDMIGRYLAFYTLMDREKIRLLDNRGSKPREDLIELFYELLSNKNLITETGMQLLTLYEDVEDERYAYDFQRLYEVRKLIHLSLASKYREEILQLYNYYARENITGDYIIDSVQGVKYREIKNTLLVILSTLDTPEIHDIIKKQYTSARNASDKFIALRLYVNSTASDKQEFIERRWKDARKDPVSWENFLYVVGGSDAKDGISLIRQVAASPDFHIEQTNEHHGLFSSFIRNRKRSLQTSEGRVLTQEILIKMAATNEYSTVAMLKTLGIIEKMDPKQHIALVSIMVALLNSTSPEKTPSVYNTAKRMLVNMKNALNAYEQQNGRLLLLQ